MKINPDDVLPFKLTLEIFATASGTLCHAHECATTLKTGSPQTRDSINRNQDIAFRLLEGIVPGIREAEEVKVTLAQMRLYLIAVADEMKKSLE